MSDPCPTCGEPMTQVAAWGPPCRDLGSFCEPCTPASGSAILPAEYRATIASKLDAAFTDLFADLEVTAPDPPKPFDPADLTRLVERVSTMQPKVDRAVIAPDVRDWLLANVATRPAEWSGPDHLWGIPVVVDEGMEPGAWELRKGDEVVRRFRSDE